MPRPFRFNLDKVLEYRSQLEDQAKIALSKAQQALRDHDRFLEMLEGDLDLQREKLASTALSAAELWLLRSYIQRLEHDLALGRQRRIELAQDVHNCREELAARAKDRKLLEKLKETQAARHVAEENRKEQAGFDEMATLRYQPPVV
ncbi:flagellar export protein FliJ [Fundidesulfovibrio agrisoli]|uniref:flagellar export protein FliJ n=1 Tax=Fundidesulfovibrio agrisoli TaxID=2922717 RepID=UPI001FAD5EF5|nr:flagellar export protein FliJ [Fundidesulfovibrio agrisoli]